MNKYPHIKRQTYVSLYEAIKIVKKECANSLSPDEYEKLWDLLETLKERCKKHVHRSCALKSNHYFSDCLVCGKHMDI